MGPPKQKKKAPAQEPKPVPRDNESRMELDLRDAREAERSTTLDAVPKKQEPEEKGKVRVEKAPKNKEESLSDLAKREDNFGGKIKALRKKMKNREEFSKYHRGNPANRPRETTLPPRSYKKRKATLGSKWGIRPDLEAGKKKKKKKKG